jgi:hypothetical protein
MRALQLISAGWVLAALGWIGTGLGAAACDENLEPGTTRGDVCKSTGLAGSAGNGKVILYLLGPLLLFVTLLGLVPLARRHIFVTGTAVAALTVAGYAVFLSLTV